MIHTIFFDIGGTLVTGRSSLHVIAEAMDPDKKEELFRYMVDEFMKIYLAPDPPRFYSIKELLRLTSKMAADKYGVKDVSDRAVELYRKNHMEYDVLYDDTLRALDKLTELGVKIVAVSDADADVLLEQMDFFDIKKFFDDIVISSHTEAYKPSDKVIARLKKHLREPYSEIMFVGDTKVDVQTAEKMGVKSVLINRGKNYNIKADYKINSLDELLDIIQKK